MSVSAAALCPAGCRRDRGVFERGAESGFNSDAVRWSAADAATASVLFAYSGASLILTMGEISAFLAEVLLDGRSIRVEADQHQSVAALASPTASLREL